jgi:hypothetical protein
MQLITSCEVAYFRSIYKTTIGDLAGMNVLFGRNDSGKSNFLRALNLFFNNHTNPGQSFDFERDLCHARRAEAEEGTDVRKFVYVKLWIDTPSTWENSLGDSFWVKKQWSVTRQDDPLLESSIKDESSKQYLTRFLNRVRFHYIPAIKDRRIFESLLADVYQVVASQEEFQESLERFSGELHTRTSSLSNDLLEKLGLKSVIAPPTDLTDLFRSLDFETESEHGDSYSLTLQRGDGVQVRHIPQILAFLSDKSRETFHLWGFEEPENSLELANAIAEADLFESYGQDKNKQIFLTSHSPAFFAKESDDVVRFFISQSKEVASRRTSIAREITEEEEPSELMGETPHLPVLSSYLTKADEKINELQDRNEKLAQEIETRDQSLVFVEGESDAIVLSAAWDIIVGEQKLFAFEEGAGTSKMEALAADGPVLNRLAPERTICVIIDNDDKGRNLYRTGHLNPGGKWYQHNSNKAHWCRLPFAEHFAIHMKQLGIPQTAWPGTLENLFDKTVREEAAAADAYAEGDTPHTELLDAQFFGGIREVLQDEEHPARIYVMSPASDCKIPFARWVASQATNDPNIVEPLKPVVEGLYEILS